MVRFYPGAFSNLPQEPTEKTGTGNYDAEERGVKSQQSDVLASLRFANPNEGAQRDGKPKARFSRDTSLHRASRFVLFANCERAQACAGLIIEHMRSRQSGNCARRKPQCKRYSTRVSWGRHLSRMWTRIQQSVTPVRHSR